ncbi:hypothetical protein HMPREF0322_00873 [Desulfitobacterium hafniense DP7]|uniref:Uncharacterized protein n=1 Tax=Desulfitobacterium hafniense DP7 TaxID=537010 RepID=G9XIU6_DESHA|nr:hypothetical protein HMPREF0322_00873 [Desulfitobacterium hafniense DP7]
MIISPNISLSFKRLPTGFGTLLKMIIGAVFYLFCCQINIF